MNPCGQQCHLVPSRNISFFTGAGMSPASQGGVSIGSPIAISLTQSFSQLSWKVTVACLLIGYASAAQHNRLSGRPETIL
uniref:Uncharacterized protein n=1 Tax=Anguilla anguilla TaxID=7936 RepID=A0A0E9XZ94_ANGAN